ncbi:MULTISPECIES: carbohydrate ABC transporter permease [Thermotoga]|uniref:Binding-protein-dependent transport systems inner membrane component n=1 Tax=Thermotoga neapolitana (strain ATCC 49049 / DSM 4359 / NBRC 107923 / NS-E) TaxID=309803 RepID=B9K9B7_THENN|nr:MULTISPECIES: carbohydrate ABC transporter permease [Thermotoga]HBF10565.1 carbohydrate ABC transporter permease [Thermotoga neapolitana]ACM23550.1 Binding-protein-dependent transport systems inner membrane component [Thermotoga neapolitana DSM 4359]AJG41452.1 sugar ABC transporter permease [Thermotoga sp. RQ7]KFZ21178.1 Binding-protein-dependent transport systems inner membrane component [Thermotoga neapolitana LA10]KHC93028.1 Binding-protein-dependent transport systems inner membrane comp
MNRKKVLKAIIFYSLSVVLVIMWMLPFIISIFTSLKTMDEVILGIRWWEPPKKPTFENYVIAWREANMKRYFINTFIITSLSVLGALFVSSLSAFALSWYNFKLKKPLLIMFVSGMLIPFQMLMIPVYRFSVRTGLYDTYWGVILFHIAFQTGFCTFFLRNFMVTIPRSLFEAAKIDGAGDFLIYRKIMMPLILPALAALGILEFTWIWNDYLWSLVLIQSDSLKPVTLGLTTLQGQWVTSWNVIAAGANLAALVPIVVFLIFQRYFIEGLTLGSVKG